MENLPNIEKMKTTINDFLNQFKTLYDFYNNDNNLSSSECTKNLRKVYNQIDDEINKLRLFNNKIEMKNREERLIKKGEPEKIRQKPGRKKKQKGGDIEIIKPEQKNIKLEQEIINPEQKNIKLEQEIIKTEQEIHKIKNDNITFLVLDEKTKKDVANLYKLFEKTKKRNLQQQEHFDFLKKVIQDECFKKYDLNKVLMYYYEGY
jgi:hypothetical protein